MQYNYSRSAIVMLILMPFLYMFFFQMIPADSNALFFALFYGILILMVEIKNGFKQLFDLFKE